MVNRRSENNTSPETIIRSRFHRSGIRKLKKETVPAPTMAESIAHMQRVTGDDVKKALVMPGARSTSNAEMNAINELCL